MAVYQIGKTMRCKKRQMKRARNEMKPVLLSCSILRLRRRFILLDLQLGLLDAGKLVALLSGWYRWRD